MRIICGTILATVVALVARADRTIVGDRPLSTWWFMNDFAMFYEDICKVKEVA